MKGEAAAGAPLKLDAPFYTEEELDALYERDPLAALRISREQHLLRRRLEAAQGAGGPASAPTPEAVAQALEEVRAILARDGGDLELVALEGAAVTVRLRGACAGCPRSALDLKHVVERLLRARVPGVAEVKSVA